ncbi:MAG: FAD-binding protein, partial [Halieaceae bacterium]
MHSFDPTDENVLQRSSGAGVDVWRRRGFLSAAATLAATCSPVLQALTDTPHTLGGTDYPGRTVFQGDRDYERWRQAMAWQLYKAPRYPEVIVRPDHREQVADVVKKCAAEGRRIAVKSGGHNVSEAFLRDGGLLLDLGELQHLELSSDGSSAWVEPALWSYELLRGLDEADKAFPVSHCATVPMGGFLMGGGIGYNHDNWGAIGCENIMAAEAVLPSGESHIISSEENPDLLWALKGAGMGFPGVVTRLNIALHPKPKSVMETAVIFPIGHLDLA